MLGKGKYSSWAGSSLRTRYFPRSRIGHGLISIAPWVNIVLLLFFFLLIDRKYVMEPGIVVELPKAPATQGSPFGMTAVVLSIRGMANGEREEIVFFDDVRYKLKQEEHQKRLQRAFSAKVKNGEESVLVIQADRNVSHGTVVDLMNMALDAGVDKVNIAVKP